MKQEWFMINEEYLDQHHDDTVIIRGRIEGHYYILMRPAEKVEADLRMHTDECGKKWVPISNWELNVWNGS